MVQARSKTLVWAVGNLNHSILSLCKSLQSSVQNRDLFRRRSNPTSCYAFEIYGYIARHVGAYVTIIKAAFSGVEAGSSDASKWPSLSRPPILIHNRKVKTFILMVPVLLLLFILIGSGLRGVDFGFHWDEICCEIRPVQTMIKTGILLPQYYYYPSFNYWVVLAGLIPDIIDMWPEKGDRQQRLLQGMEDYSYRLRLRAIFIIITSFSVLWVYLLVLHWRRSWVEALLASSFLTLSWEVAYHLRWIATDAMLMQFGALTLLFTIFSWIKPDDRPWLTFAAITGGYN